MFNNLFISISSNSIQNQTNIPIELDALQLFIRAKIPKDNYFSIANVSEADVFDMLIMLNINKFSGFDGIGPQILKIAAKWPSGLKRCLLRITAISPLSAWVQV